MTDEPLELYADEVGLYGNYPGPVRLIFRTCVLDVFSREDKDTPMRVVARLAIERDEAENLMKALYRELVGSEMPGK